ncbi:MAG: DsbA family protein, partial [Planctomycetota bacterium]
AATYVQEAWRQVEGATGAPFNHEFWTTCAPRRSTYPACRAAIAAERLSPGSLPGMFEAIQRAYYLEARNPSDLEVLISCAESLDLEPASFARELASAKTQQTFEEHLARRERLGAEGFPSLYFTDSRTPPTLVMRGYASSDEVMRRIAKEANA